MPQHSPETRRLLVSPITSSLGEETTFPHTDQRLISQRKAAAIAGLGRRKFLMALYHAKVEASQVDIEEIKDDVGPWASCWPPSGSG